MNKRIKQSVKVDRSAWLDDLLQHGRWDQVRRLRKGTVHKQGRIRDASGELVSSEARAETIAEYLEKVQWAVRPTTAATSSASLGPELPVNMGQITEAEIVKAAGKLRWGKASGTDDLPPEFWKAVVVTGTPASRWGTDLCQRCWDDGCVPEAWHQARVATIFKQGDVADCRSYRPIYLLPIGYNLFARTKDLVHPVWILLRAWNT